MGVEARKKTQAKHLPHPPPAIPDPGPHTWTRRPPCVLRALSGNWASGGLRRLEPRRWEPSLLHPGTGSGTLHTAGHFLFENIRERKS